MNWNLPLVNDSMGCACNCWQSRKRFRCKHVNEDGDVAEGIVVVGAQRDEDHDEHNDADDDDDDDDDEDVVVSMGGTLNAAPDGAVDVISADVWFEQGTCNDIDDNVVADSVVAVVATAASEEFNVEVALKSLLWYAGVVSGVLGTCWEKRRRRII